MNDFYTFVSIEFNSSVWFENPNRRCLFCDETLIFFQNFLDICSSCLIRDFDSLAGAYILETAVALAKYQALRLELVSKIFSPEFMDRLDAEIGSSTLAYAKRVRKIMMELNRTVCLQYPEFKVTLIIPGPGGFD